MTDVMHEVLRDVRDLSPGVMSEAEIEQMLSVVRAEDGRATRAALRKAVQRVNRGAARLDVYNPEWMGRIKIDRLALSDGQYCILGQTYGDYESQSTYAFLGFNFDEDSPGFDGWDDPFSKRAIKHGFLEDNDNGQRDLVTFAYLDVVWVNLLSRRARSGRKELLPEVPQARAR